MSAIAGRVLILPKGDFDASVTYEFLDLVNHNSSSWLAKKASTGVEPSDENLEFWQKFGSSVTPDGVTIVIDENGVISAIGGTSDQVTYENESVVDVTNVKEALDGIFDGTQQVGDSAKLGGKALNDIVLQESKVVYVSPSGSDENGDGTEGNPWKTIQKAINECPIAAFNTSMYSVYVANGVYVENVEVRRKIVRLQSTDASNANVTIKGSVTAGYSSTLETKFPITIDAVEASVVNCLSVGDGALLNVANTTIIAKSTQTALAVNPCGLFFGYGKVTIDGAKNGVVVNNSSNANFYNGISVNNCSVGLDVEHGGKLAYNALETSNVTTEFITKYGGRIYTGAQTSVGNY